MQRLPLMLALVVSVAAATAQAQEPTPSPAPASTAQAAPVVADEQKPTAATGRKRLSDEHCLRQTGSRITQRDGKPRCTGQPGRVYSKDDIDRTGHPDLADALRALDPALN